MHNKFELIKKAAVEDKLAHFLLFHGSGREERTKAALEIAQLLNCREDERPCGSCSSCKKVKSGNHPDIYIIGPRSSTVSLEQVLELREKIFRRPYEGRYKVCLLEEADRLTLPAANALLRITEAPPENTVIILSTVNAGSIIVTLQSRAQEVYFPWPAEKEWQYEKGIYELSGGDPDLARKINELGSEKLKEKLAIYLKAVESGDFLKIFSLFPLEKEETLVFLQVLAVLVRKKVNTGEAFSLLLKEVGKTAEAVRRQANHRLALEVLALKHIKMGGNKIG